MSRKPRIILGQLSILAIVAVGWEIVGRTSPRTFFLIGSPSAIGTELERLMISGDLWWHGVVTGGEATAGFLLGTSTGSLIGLSLWYSEAVAKVAKPFLVALGAMPIFAFAPIMIVWFGVGVEMKVAMATFSTIFVALTQAYRGATSVSLDHLEFMKALRASNHQIFRKAIVPGSMDWVLSSMRLNVGFGLLGAFIGEFIAADKGLGYLVLRASSLYNIPRVFAAGLGIVLLALLLDALAGGVERRRHILVQLISVPRSLWQ